MDLMTFSGSFREPQGVLVAFAGSNQAVAQSVGLMQFAGSLKTYQVASRLPIIHFSGSLNAPKNASKPIVQFAGGSYKNGEQCIFDGKQTTGLGEDYGLRLVLSRNNGDVLDLDVCQLGRDVSVQHARNENFILNFEVIEQTRINLNDELKSIDYMRDYGLRAELSIITDSREILLFKGRVVGIDVDVFTGKRTISCSSLRKQQIEALDIDVIRQIGVTNKYIHGDFDGGKDKQAEFDARLSTVTASYDFTAGGIGYLNSWLPNPAPDRAVDNCDIYFRQPEISFVQWGSVLNNITINIAHEFSRVYQRDINYTIDVDVGICNASQYKQTPSYDDVLNAARQTSWELRYYGFSRLPASGLINCPSGGQLMWHRPKDDKGIRSGSVTLSKRWERHVTHNYAITLRSLTSMIRFGVMSESQNYTVNSEIDNNNIELSNFGSFNSDYQAEISNYEIRPKNNVLNRIDKSTLISFGGKKVNKDEQLDLKNDADLKDAVDVALRVARVKIFDSHQKNTITITTKFMPDISVAQTHLVDCDYIKGSFKVLKFEHIFDLFMGLAETKITYAVFQAGGIGANYLRLPKVTNWATPFELNNINTDGGYDYIESHAGIIKIDPQGQVPENASGMVYKKIGNTLFEPIGFQIVTPEIPESETNSLSANATLSVDDIDIYENILDLRG